jgi:hypothetical protein
MGADRPALLRKDFLLDEYQLWEARLYGADTVLLIVAILTDEQLTTLMSQSRAMGMEPLVEVANAAEMKRALDLKARIIGINNRNLHDFTVDMGNSTTLTAGLGEWYFSQFGVARMRFSLTPAWSPPSMRRYGWRHNLSGTLWYHWARKRDPVPRGWITWSTRGRGVDAIRRARRPRRSFAHSPSNIIAFVFPH